MSSPKQHHFVPSTYLRNFQDARGHIWCYDSKTEKTYSQIPEKIARRGDYNTASLPDGTIDRDTIEAFYGVSETVFPQLVKGIRERSLNFEDQRALINFCALQAMRSPLTRDLIAWMAKKYFPADYLPNALLGVTAHEYSILRRAREGDQQASDELSLRLSGHFFQHYIRLMENLDFVVITIKDGGQLITSDNPAYMGGISRDHKKKWKIEMNLPDKRLVVIYPISPNTLLFGDRAKAGVFGFRFASIEQSDALERSVNDIIALSHRTNIFGSSKKIVEEAAALCSKSSEDTISKVDIIAARVGKVLGYVYSQAKFIK